MHALREKHRSIACDYFWRTASRQSFKHEGDMISTMAASFIDTKYKIDEDILLICLNARRKFDEATRDEIKWEASQMRIWARGARSSWYREERLIKAMAMVASSLSGSRLCYSSMNDAM